METHRIAGDFVRNTEIDSCLSQYPRMARKDRKTTNGPPPCLRWGYGRLLYCSNMATLFQLLLFTCHGELSSLIQCNNLQFHCLNLSAISMPPPLQLWCEIRDHFGASGAQKDSPQMSRLSVGVAARQGSQSAHQGDSRGGGAE